MANNDTYSPSTEKKIFLIRTHSRAYRNRLKGRKKRAPPPAHSSRLKQEKQKKSNSDSLITYSQFLEQSKKRKNE